MELGALVCVAGRRAAESARSAPGAPGCWPGSPPHDGPARRVQKFAGTDRQVRGRLLDVLRAAHEPVAAGRWRRRGTTPSSGPAAWTRCSTDGLVEQTADGLFTLPA